MKKLFLLLCVVITSSSALAQVSTVWELVTDYSTLNVADTFVIAGNHTANGTVWHTLKNNEITTAAYLPIGSALTVSNNRITSTVSNNETWKLESTGTTGVYYIKSTKGAFYLQYGSGAQSLITSKPSSNKLGNAKWRIHYTDYDNDNVYSVTGLFSGNISPVRMLAVYDGATRNWHSETRNYYKSIQNQEVILFRKVTISNASVSAAEYATFSSPYALDFSGEEGLTVYTASVGQGKVSLHEVTSKRVPANTAVVLHGTSGSYTGAVIAEADALTGNDLHIATEAMSGADNNIYVLNKKNGVVGFYKLSATGTLAQGKAYLTQEGGAPMLSMSDDGEATAVRDVPLPVIAGNSICYTLDGRRVAHPTKGVYIQNGRKMVVR